VEVIQNEEAMSKGRAMKKRFAVFPMMLAVIIMLCHGDVFAETQPMSDNVKDYEVLRKSIFNPNNNAIDRNYPSRIYIMYVTTAPLGRESITVHNNSGRPVDMSHWTLGNAWNRTAYLIPQGTIMYQGNMRTFSNPGLGFQFVNKGETIYLQDYSRTLIDTWKNP
jgi:hypothetical protein